MAQSEDLYLSETCTWRGHSGRRWRFSVFDLDSPTLDLSAIFVLAREGDLFAAYRPLYVGEADSLGLHLPRAPERSAAAALGATSLHILYVDRGNEQRLSIWRDMIAHYAPPLNRARAGFAPRPVTQTCEIIPFPLAARAR